MWHSHSPYHSLDAYIVYMTFWMCWSIWSCISFFQLIKQVINTFCLIYSASLDVVKRSVYSTFPWSFYRPPHLFRQCPEEGEVGNRNTYTDILNICRWLHNSFLSLILILRQKYNKKWILPNVWRIFSSFSVGYQVEERRGERRATSLLIAIPIRGCSSVKDRRTGTPSFMYPMMKWNNHRNLNGI